MSAFDQAVHTVRFLAADAVQKANSGHPGTPMALAGIAVELYTAHLRYDPQEPSWPNRDRFVLSCGHASMLQYAILHLAGYEVSLEDLKQFRQLGSKTPGHPEFGHTAGVETTTGPLGQGVGNAVGLALAGKLAAARVNTKDATLIDYNVYALASDGDLMEGVASEAASIAGHLRLDNLIVIYDDNSITIDGGTEKSFSEDVPKRFEAYGWATERIDGHDAAAVKAAIERGKKSDRPYLIAAKTLIGIGAPTLAGTSEAHGSPLGDKEIAGAKKALGWPENESFRVPLESKEPFAAWTKTTKALRAEWNKKVAGLGKEQKAALDQLLSREVPATLLESLVESAPTEKGATRALAAKVEQRVAELVPALLGGAADLAASTKTLIKGSGDVTAQDFSGRNLHFGIREHGMGSVLNGLALSGFFIPFGSTFLIFCDYMRPPMRLAALMKQQVLYVFTHDSIFVGEDGPTHQPVEQIAALRLIPNLYVARPADGLECAGAYALALSRRDGPTALALTRQDLPPLERPASFTPRDMLKGAYVVNEADGTPDLVLIASGSEVAVALDAKPLLEESGRKVRVVSALCWDAFAELPKAEQDKVLPPGVKRVSLEAGVTASWAGVVGLDGLALGIDRFGECGPYKQLSSVFGLTGEQVARAVLEKL